MNTLEPSKNVVWRPKNISRKNTLKKRYVFLMFSSDFHISDPNPGNSWARLNHQETLSGGKKPHFSQKCIQSADVLCTHEPGQCLVSLCGALCIFEYFQLQTRKTFQIVSKNTFSRIFNSRPEFSRIGGDNSKTQKAHFQSCGDHFWAFSAPRPQKAPIFAHFQLQIRKAFQIVRKAHF